MSKSSKPLLIVTGDSWSDPRQLGYEDIKVWPEKVAEFMDWDLLNVSCMGQGNDYICNAAIDAIVKNHDREIIVFPLWSQANRLNTWDLEPGLIFTPHQIREYKEDTPLALLEHQIREYFKNTKYWTEFEKNGLTYDNRIIHCINSTLRSVWLLNDFCEKRSIQILHNCALPLIVGCHWISGGDFTHEEDNQLTDMYESYVKEHSVYYDKVDKIKHKVVSSFFNRQDSTLYRYRRHLISAENKHPNQKGHDLIAYDFIRKYEEISNSDDEYVTPVFVYD